MAIERSRAERASLSAGGGGRRAAGRLDCEWERNIAVVVRKTTETTETKVQGRNHRKADSTAAVVVWGCRMRASFKCVGRSTLRCDGRLNGGRERRWRARQTCI